MLPKLVQLVLHAVVCPGQLSLAPAVGQSYVLLPLASRVKATLTYLKP